MNIYIDTKYKSLTELGYVVRPPMEMYDYYTIGSRNNGRFVIFKKDEELSDESITLMLSNSDVDHDRKVHCCCGNDSCKLEHHTCLVYNRNPFEDCIHIIMRDGKSTCNGCNELWDELKNEEELKNMFSEKLDKCKKDLHNVMMKFIHEYRDSYNKLISQ